MLTARREEALPPADWEALRKELIRLNVVALAQTANRFMTDHDFNTRIAIWSEGKGDKEQIVIQKQTPR